MSKNLKIDREKCIHCGKCAGDCIAKCLVMDKEENIIETTEVVDTKETIQKEVDNLEENNKK